MKVCLFTAKLLACLLSNNGTHIFFQFCCFRIKVNVGLVNILIISSVLYCTVRCLVGQGTLCQKCNLFLLTSLQLGWWLLLQCLWETEQSVAAVPHLRVSCLHCGWPIENKQRRFVRSVLSAGHWLSRNGPCMLAGKVREFMFLGNPSSPVLRGLENKTQPL